MHAQSLSRVQHFCDPHQAPLPVEFSRQQCWSGLPFPTPGDLPDPGIKAGQVSCIAGIFFTVWATREAQWLIKLKTFLNVGG